MDGKAVYLYNFMEGRRKRFVIPVYQRNYNWKREQCKKLFDDILDVHRNDKRSHFFGSIVSVNKDDKEYTVIDGQQRMTTVSLIYIAMINATKNGVFTEDKDVKASNAICEDFIIAEDDDNNKLRLRPYNVDKNAFQALVFDPEENYIQDSNVTINYRYFYDRIVNDREMSLTQLRDAMEKLQIITIELKPELGDDPQLIFESLNSTGLALSESDKIRNFILMGLPPQEQTDLYLNYWFKIENLTRGHLEEFIFNFLMIRVAKVKSSEIYKTFKEFAKSKDNRAILADMLRYATIFSNLIHHNLGDTVANVVKDRIDRLRITTPTPFLMSYLKQYEDEQWDKEELRKVLSTLESYLLRRAVCEHPTNALRNIFASLHQRILRLKGDSESSYSDVMIYILEKSNITFPNNDEFKEAFCKAKVYNFRPYIRSYILDRLERKNNAETINVFDKLQNPQTNEKKFSVEHIMPQTLTEAWVNELGGDFTKANEIHNKWLHTIANLTVTAYNSELSNSPFAKKKEAVFRESTLHLNDFVRECEHWTEHELEQRRDMLVDDALELWEYPTTSFAPVVAESPQITLDDEDFDYTGKQLSSVSILGESYAMPILEWKKAMIWLYKQLFDIDPQPLFEMAADPQEVYIISEENSVATKIANGINIYFNTDTNTKIRVLRRVAERYRLNEGDDNDDIVFTLKVKETQE